MLESEAERIESGQLDEEDPLDLYDPREDWEDYYDDEIIDEEGEE